MLGNDVLSVRLGGIYALHSLAEEHPHQYYVQSMRLLCAFVRHPHKHEDTGNDAVVQNRIGQWKPKLRADVQAVMDMMHDRKESLLALEKEKGI